MKKLISTVFLTFCAFVHLVAQLSKAPAYPLITHDPYFSIWSMTDTLHAAPTKHWTGADQPLIGLVKVDGKLFRFMGNKSIAYQTVIPTSEEKTYDTKYTETEPAGEWMKTSFNDQSWKSGRAPFGSCTNPASSH